mmetsp:Transcript_35470/g.67957  ORF Transcript_35470/g.67957 Transcript_35470/m.67957 type:complete len:648 (+) Transcript_35470:97-2040(+)|eukprot:CAMPEP_0114248794 /NCGR_PEP_ID=MMETSP0058-20121206/13773_1 /TAXON_ID=36894 /ORGANISM="Pyramimonas parkeae, CCMP726" /LENGTH=647 /DNA_ID=CAMNT_0001362245 /DNA_START=94 /DNA_END=2037 /DNA_ORIENTATION=-
MSSAIRINAFGIDTTNSRSPSNVALVGTRSIRLQRCSRFVGAQVPAVPAQRMLLRMRATNTTAEISELSELKAANAEMRAQLREAVLYLQQIGGNDEESCELLTNKDASLAELSEDIDWPSPTDEVPFWERSARKDTALPLVLPPPPKAPKDDQCLHIVHVSAELAPIAKVGGLGDAVAGLASSCKARGHKVECMLPFYSCIDESQIQGLTMERKLNSFFKQGWMEAEVYKGTVEGIPVILIKPLNSNLFQGGAIYGGSYNEMEAYLYFSRACLEYLHSTARQPHILHYHDWHLSAVPVLYWDMYHKMGLTSAKPVLTIHNMDNTGECKVEELEWTGLEGELYKVDTKLMDPRTKGHNPERLSLLKGGIVYASAVTTVSPTYAAEILGGGASGWMKDTLDVHKAKFHGLLNGIDRAVWDPERDATLPAQFSSVNPAAKVLCKKFVAKGLGMPEDTETERTPLVVCISRLVPQKGIHLIKQGIKRTAEKGGAFILLGSSNNAGTNNEFLQLAEEFKDNPKIKILIMYSEALSHHLYAAADMVLVPSMFEPCGLTQLVGLQYGGVPVVRRTGGLADTVHDVDDSNCPELANGFCFDGTDEASLNGALDRALDYYAERPDWWSELSQKNMTIDNSWSKSAEGYVDLYKSL